MKRKNRRIITILVSALAIAAVAAGVYVFVVKLPSLRQGAGKVQSTLSDAQHTAALVKEFFDGTPDQVLVLFQNSNELRPTGGFITAIGEATVQHGQLNSLSVTASDAFDETQSVQPPLPAEMSGLISTPFLTIRDANLDVDFATSAASIQELYRSATNTNPETIVAVTTRANEKIVELTGPIEFTINGISFVVDHRNVTDELQRLTDQEFESVGLTKEERKQVLAAFAEALVPKLRSYVQAHPAEMFSTIQSLITTYDLQVWSSNAAIAEHTNALRVSQKVEPYPPQDALLIVDTNLKSKKTDPFIDQTVALDVALNGNEVVNTLSVTYKNNATESFTTTEYKDYVRVYVPNGSELKNAQELSEVKTTIKHNRTVFSGLVRVPVGETRTVTYVYKVGVLRDLSLADYTLLLERQPGSRSIPMTLTVHKGDELVKMQTDFSKDQLIKIDQNK